MMCIIIIFRLYKCIEILYRNWYLFKRDLLPATSKIRLNALLLRKKHISIIKFLFQQNYAW